MSWLAGSILAFARHLLPAHPAFDAYLARIAARPAFIRARAKDAPASADAA